MIRYLKKFINDRFALFILISGIFGLLIRLGYSYNKEFWLVDPVLAENERVARCLYEEGVFGGAFSDSCEPTSHVSPVYPTLLGTIYYFNGEPTIVGKSILAIFLATLGIIILVYFSRNVLKSSISVTLAVSLLFVLPFYFQLETAGDHETTLISLVLSILLLISFRIINHGWGKFINQLIIGIVFGFSVLISPMFLPFILVFAVCELYRNRFNFGILRRQLIVAIIASIFLIPWGIRNMDQLGKFIISRSNLGLELQIGNHDKAIGHTFGYHEKINSISPFDYYHPFVSQVEKERYIQMGEVEYMNYKKQMALNWISENPSKFIYLCFKRFIIFWFPINASTPYSLVKSIVFCFTAFIAFVFGARSIIVGNYKVSMIFTLMLSICIPYTITHVDYRYRYPIFGVSILIFFLALEAVIKYLNARRIKTN